MAQVVEHLPSKHEALSSTPLTKKRKAFTKKLELKDLRVVTSRGTS
jgi:hypothetical protein